MSVGVLISSHTPRVRGGLLQRCLDSVWSQERLPDQVAIAIDQEGRGAAWCKQQALEMLQTTFVAVIDSDDYMMPHHLRIHEEAQLQTGADLVYSWFETSPPGGDPFPSFFFTDPWDEKNPRHTTTTIVARRDMMLKVGYTEDSNMNSPYADDDWRMTLGLIELGAKVHHIPERSWTWDIGHGGNTSGRAIWR